MRMKKGSTGNHCLLLIEMEFIDRKSGATVVVRLFIPTFDQDNDAWYCLGEISGLNEGALERSYGNNAFQAILMAMARFRLLFDRSGSEFESARGEHYDIVFPKYIPWAYGADIYNRLCAIVDSEVQKIENETTIEREEWEARRRGKE